MVGGFAELFPAAPEPAGAVLLPLPPRSGLGLVVSVGVWLVPALTC
jgi:hypothetical protein